MKSPTALLVASIAALVAFICSAFAAYTPPANNRADFSLNYDWKFIKQDVSGASATAFNDSAWSTVSLPHSWNDDKFREWITPTNDAAADPLRPTGTYYGKAWYRKHFTIDAAYTGRKVLLEFQGIGRWAKFYINGQYAGLHENGVAPCGVDITQWVVYGGDNVLAVQVDNDDSLDTDPAGPYHGAPYPYTQPYNPNFGGLNRSVVLHITDPLYQTLPLYRNLGTVGTYIYIARDGSNAPIVDTLAKTCTLAITAEVKNDYATSKTATLEAVIVDAAGNQVGGTLTSSPQVLTAGQKATFAVNASLTGVHFWSPDYPYLYQIYTIVKVGGVAVDVEKTPFGVRKFIFNSTYGLQVNGHPLYLDGYAPRTSMEWPCVGTPVDWMNEYDFKLMKEDNANFVRPMHIGPRKVQVDAADKFGIVLALPCADNEGDTTNADMWQERLDIMRDLTIYFRNSPSVLFYEGANQVISAQHMQDMLNVRLQWDPYGGRFSGTRSNDPNITFGIREYGSTMDINGASIATPLWDAEYARGESPRRVWDNYTPMLNPRWDGVNAGTTPVAGTVGDTTHRYLLGGYFYIAANYHQALGLSSGNGDYIGDYLTPITTPGSSLTQHPYFRLQNSEDMVLENLAKYYGRYMRSVFVQPPAISAEDGVMVGGAKIIWSDSVTDGRMHDTEVTRVSGAVDGARLPKEVYYGLQVAHADPVTQPMVYVVGHWNYAAGTVKRVYVVSNTAQVKLQTFNTSGTLITDYGFGVKNFFPASAFGASSDQQNNYVFAFDNVAFQPGSIKAIGYNNGSSNPVATHTKTTAGAPAALRITPIVGPSGQWRADGNDIAMFDVEVVDSAGNRCPTWEDSVTFSCSGNGTFLGGYNSGKRYSTNLNNLTSGYNLNLECGINRVFARSTRTAGGFTLNVTKSGLTPASSTINSTAFTLTNGLASVTPQQYTVPLGAEPPAVAEGNAPPPPPNAPNPAPDTNVLNLHYSGGHPDEAVLAQNVRPGDLVYMDSSTITFPSNLPRYLVGGEFIRPFKSDAGETSSTDQYQFDITRFSYIYQLIDSANGMPNHNNNASYGWTLLPETVTINGRTMKIYKSRLMQPYENGYFAANGKDATPFSTSSNMYLVFVVNAEQELQLPTNTITATSTQGTNTAGKAIDADVSTRWNASSNAFPQVVNLDFGRNVLVGGYQINWQSADTKSYKYKVEVSADGTTYDTSLDMTGNVNLGADEYRVPAVGAFAGRYVRITVTAASGGGWAAINEMKVYGVLDAAPAAAIPTVTSVLTASGQAGYNFTYTIAASGSPTGFAAQGLPSGWSLNGNTGVISGITMQYGTIPITISGVNTAGTGSAILNVTLAAPPPVPVITGALSYSAQAGVSIPTASAYFITATNMTYTPVSYGADLPYQLGLTLSASTGKIAGTPKWPGTYQIPISATNPGGTGSATLSFTVTPNGPAPVVSSAASVSGTVGTALTYAITASNSPTLYGATTLPPGLSLSTSTGAITGTPTTAGTYVVTVSATGIGGTGTKDVTFTIVPNPLAPQITSPLTASGFTSQAFSYQIVATNSPTSYSATGLPPGLVVNTTTGAITGTPTTVGTSNVTIKATNASGFDSKTLVIMISATPMPPVVTSNANAVGSVGAPFSYQIAATNNPTSYSATPLPPGLSVNATTGAITGTPTATGTTSVTIGAANADGTGTKALSIVISAAGADINLALSQPATASSNHTSGNTAAKAVDGDSTVTRWESDYTDPQWIQVDLGATRTIHSIVLVWQNAAGKDYTIEGSADGSTWTNLVAPIVGNNSSGTFTFNTTGNPTARYVRVYGTARKMTQYGYSLYEFQVMGPASSVAQPPSITSALTASGTVGVPFSYTITATNSPTSFSAAPLPAGLSFNSTTGAISGTPATAATTNVAIGASNSAGSDSKTLVVTISSASGDTNIAQGLTSVVASSTQTGNDAYKGCDGNATTRWAASSGAFPQAWTIDFGSSKTFSRADIAWYSSASRYYQYKIETSPDDATYTLRVDRTSNTLFGDTSDNFAATARYVKITITGASAGFASAYEFKIFGH